MGKQREHYQQVLDKLYLWLRDAAEQQSANLIQVVDTAKAYIQATEELTQSEIQALEQYLLRDFQAFQEGLAAEVNNSLWWQSEKNRFWRLLANLADQNQLQMLEMQLDVQRNGLYRAGELIALGELRCTQCAQVFPVNHVQAIPPCWKCNGLEFSRIA